MLVRCRDHLRPRGLMFFAVPSRCIDVSAFLSRRMLEGLFDALDFDVVEQKRTPKISFYVLQRRSRGQQSVAYSSSSSASTSSSGSGVSASSVSSGTPHPSAAFAASSSSSAAAATSSRPTAPAESAPAVAAAVAGKKRPRSSSDAASTSATISSLSVSPALPVYTSSSVITSSSGIVSSKDKSSGGHASSCSSNSSSSSAVMKWRPVIVPDTPEAAAALRRLYVLKQLPASEQPLTGFTKTDFSIVIPAEWVRSAAPSR